VSEKERKVELSALFKDVASIIVEKCVNPETQRPYTLGMIERGLRDVHIAVDPKRPAKQQALEAIPKLRERFPIERAMMRVALSVPVATRAELADVLATRGARCEAEDLVGEAYQGTYLIQPGTFRELYNFVSQQARGAGRLEVIAVSAQDAAVEPSDAAGSGAGGAGASSTGDGAFSAATQDGRGRGVAVSAAMSSGAGSIGGIGGGGGGGFVAAAVPVVAPAARARAEPSGEVRCPTHCCAGVTSLGSTLTTGRMLVTGWNGVLCCRVESFMASQLQQLWLQCRMTPAAMATAMASGVNVMDNWKRC
jgi:SBDS protein C-terminal domain